MGGAIRNLRGGPHGWVLAGGQASYLYAIERKAGVGRPTDDADTVLNIGNSPEMLLTSTSKLVDLGFKWLIQLEGVEDRRGDGGIEVEFSDDGSFHAIHLEDLDVPHHTFTSPDLTTFCRLDELGIVVTGQYIEPDRAVLACTVVGTGSVVPPLRRRGCPS